MINSFSVALAENLTITPKGVTLIPNLGSFISAGAGAIFLIAFIIFLAMLIWGGIGWLTSGSDKENTQKARDRITNALIGVAIVASAWAVTRAVEWFFGVKILNGIQLPSAVQK